MIARDHATERLARIDLMCAEVSRNRAAMERPNPVLIRQLTITLEAMLKELRGHAPERSSSGRNLPGRDEHYECEVPADKSARV